MNNGRAITLVEAINQALAYALEHDPDVVMIGEDIGVNGGVFRATVGLQARFGAERVRDTPLAENMLAGIGLGMAAQGLKPIVEIQFMGFIYACVDQIISHISRIRNRTRGRLSSPLVIRTPYGAGIHSPEHHSESTEAIFAHIPGIRVVIPSTPLRAYGLLLAAIRSPDPVLFLEPTRLYRRVKEIVPNTGDALPLDLCYVSREGHHVTLVSWGAMMHETLEAALKLAESGIEAEVIDVATIKPLDMATILASVEKTGRCVIIQEATKSFSVGSEIAAQLAEKGLMFLLAPVGRVAPCDIIVPLYKMEKYYLPSVEHILKAVHRVMEFA